MKPEEQKRLIAMCGRAFSPSAPVNKLTLFAGRIEQIRKITEAVNTRGRHAMMYGDRGVGKTSLANILKDLFADANGLKIVKLNCAATDDFRNVWRKALSEINAIQEAHLNDEDKRPTEETLGDRLNEYEHVGPGEIRELLESVSQEGFEIVIVFDEFDRLENDHRNLFSDTIKDLSDNSVSVTLVLVGVASDIAGLIAEHASIDRCLRHVPMPRMSGAELSDIIDKALTTLGMSISTDAVELIVALSQGLPHYTHLLGQEAAQKALSAARLDITENDVIAAIKEAIDKTDQTVRSDYHKACQTQRKGTLFPQVLLACALAEVDDLGYFKSADVRDPLCDITNQKYDIPNYAQHLDKFASEESRGPVLEKWGTNRRFRFRFRNSMLRPFIIMQGLADQMISGTLLEKLKVDNKKAWAKGMLFK